MRILFLCRPYIHTTIGGVPEFLRNLMPVLQNLGVDLTFYTQTKDLDEKRLFGPELLWDTIPYYNGPFLKPRFFVRSKEVNPLIRLCQDLSIQLIHSQGIYRCGYMAKAVKKQTGIPYILTSHSDILATNSDRMNRPHILRRTRKIMADASHLTHLTPFMENAAHEIYDTRDKSTLIGNGINPAEWAPFTELPEKDYMLGIGRLERTKGFHVLIDTYAELRKAGVTTSLIIAGSGKNEKELHAQARERGLNVILNHQNLSNIPPASIVFTGYITGTLKKELYGHSKFVLFSPQWEEPFGIVQLEAMAAGKALIASDTMATRYLQQLGLQATLVKADDRKAWAAAIQALLNDPARQKTTGQNNLIKAKQFAWQTIAQQYKNVYERALQQTA